MGHLDARRRALEPAELQGLGGRLLARRRLDGGYTFDDRHTHARIGFFYRPAGIPVDERPANGGWTYGGHVLPDGGYVLAQAPVAELEVLDEETTTVTDLALADDETVLDDPGTTYEVVAEIDTGDAEEVGLRLRERRGEAGSVDEAMVVGVGALTGTMVVYPGEGTDGLSVYARGGRATVRSLEVTRLASIWR